MRRTIVKEQLYRFRLPLIAAAVILLFVVAALLIRLAGGAAGGETEDYFEGSLYPATCEEREDGTLLVTVDGSATPELNWQVENESTDLCEVSIKKKEKSLLVCDELTGFYYLLLCKFVLPPPGAWRSNCSFRKKSGVKGGLPAGEVATKEPEGLTDRGGVRGGLPGKRGGVTAGDRGADRQRALLSEAA